MKMAAVCLVMGVACGARPSAPHALSPEPKENPTSKMRRADVRELPPAAVIELTLGPLQEVSNDGINAALVEQKILTVYAQALQQCFADCGACGRGATVELTFVIARTGGVPRATTGGAVAGLETCMTGRARTWVFEDPKRATATFILPAEFRAVKD